MLDGFARSLRSLREEMALSDGATEERPDGGQETNGGPDVVYVEGGPWLEAVRLEM